MNKKLNISKTLLNLILILVCGISYSQVEINGYIKSSVTDAPPFYEMYLEVKQNENPYLFEIVTSDKDGFFKIQNLIPNQLYNIKITGDGYDEHFFEIKTNETITKVNLTMETECEYSKEQAEKDWKNGNPKLLLVGSIAPIANSRSDKRFERNFGVKYLDFGCTPPIMDCILIYNQRIFEFLDNKYGSSWRNSVRSDVKYLD